ncbi:MAG: aminopeptidase P family protein [Lachnospiraceae bacterium]|nr:aminopeptidase P family protein [Lachnospiraceae bacterium]
MLEKRRAYLKNAVRKEQMAAVLIDSPSNLYYYTGFTGGEAMFVMTVKDSEAAKDSSEGYLITDSRYYEQVEKECPGLTLIRLEKKGYSETVKMLLDRLKGVGDIDFMEDDRADGIKIAVEDSMRLSQYMKLCETCQGYAFQTAGETINQSRMVKDEQELLKIARAEEIGDAAFSYILGVIKPGITESEVALELEFFMKRQGASGLSFDTIVASGANSSMPHAQVTDKRIEYGDFVTMDFGCIYQGYCSDMTRTIAVGKATQEMEKIYQIVLDANRYAMEGIREGVSCKAVDALAREHIKKQGYGEYFGHALGHGVGVDIHEEPRFSQKCEVIIKENMVITDEPGIYIPGRFGVRIEDLVVVKKDGYRKLSQSEKELIVL